MSKDLQQNLHSEDNFLKHTIIIYSHYDNSMIKNLKTKIVTNTVRLLGTKKQSASLGSTAPTDHSIKVAQF